MARKPDVSEFTTFESVTNRLDEIVDAVRDKDLSLERSLDLFDEAIALGSKAVDLVDSPVFSAEEVERMADTSATDQSAAEDAEAEADAAEDADAKVADAEAAEEADAADDASESPAAESSDAARD